MSQIRLALALLPFIAGSPAAAATASDPIGDFLPSFTGTPTPDLDVTSFSVSFDASTNDFLLEAVFAGAIDPSTPGFYVIGVDTGAGAIDPFDAIGNGNVTFDQVIVVQQSGTGTVGANPLTVALAGNMFSVTVPLAFLPSTGADPGFYGFNIWPREGTVLTGNEQISDFAPDNALLRAVPEPSTWLMMLLGFGLAGATLRLVRAQATGESRLPEAA